MLQVDTWYKKVIRENRKEIVYSAIFALSVLIAIELWQLLTGETFQWESIEPIEQPSIFNRLLYSALTFIGIGAIVFGLGFYRWLYSLYRGERGGWREYKNTKKDLWFILMVLTFFIVALMINVLNAILSFFYNLFFILLYLAPPVGIAGVVLLLFYFLFIKKKYEKNKNGLNTHK